MLSCTKNIQVSLPKGFCVKMPDLSAWMSILAKLSPVPVLVFSVKAAKPPVCFSLLFPFLFARLSIAKCSFFYCTSTRTAHFCVFIRPETSKSHHCWKAPKGHGMSVSVSFTSCMKQSVNSVIDTGTFCQIVIPKKTFLRMQGGLAIFSPLKFIP